MFPIESTWGRAAVTEMSEAIFVKETPPDDAILSGLFTHTGTDIALGGFVQRTLFEYTLSAYISRVCQNLGIKPIGSRIVEVPLRNCNVYEHIFETKDKKQFYCYQYGNCPSNPFDQLTFSWLEREVTTGCINCNYKGFTDEDIVCNICRNGLVRKLVSDNDLCKTFKTYGYLIFKEAIGERHFNILEKFREHYISSNTDSFEYKCKMAPLMRSYVDEERFGEYFDADLERDILILYDSKEFDDEIDEGKDQTQDDDIL